MDEILVRRFIESDLNDVYDVIHRAFDSYELGRVYERETHDIWCSIYTEKYIYGISKLRHFYVASYNGKIVGCAAVHLVESMAYVSAVYIDPNCHGLGIGKKLLEAVEKDEICQQTGKIYLHALLSAIKFYQKQGFGTAGEIPEIINDCGIDVVEMIKKI